MGLGWYLLKRPLRVSVALEAIFRYLSSFFLASLAIWEFSTLWFKVLMTHGLCCNGTQTAGTGQCRRVNFYFSAAIGPSNDMHSPGKVPIVFSVFPHKFHVGTQCPLWGCGLWRTILPGSWPSPSCDPHTVPDWVSAFFSTSSMYTLTKIGDIRGPLAHPCLCL